jgi:hypothetical protein
MRHEIMRADEFTRVGIDKGLEPVLVILDLYDMSERDTVIVLCEELERSGEVIVRRGECGFGLGYGVSGRDRRRGRRGRI